MIFHIPFYLSAIFEVIFSIYHKVLKVYLIIQNQITWLQHLNTDLHNISQIFYLILTNQVYFLFCLQTVSSEV